MTQRGKVVLACGLWLVLLTFVAFAFVTSWGGVVLILLAAAWAAFGVLVAATVGRAVLRSAARRSRR